MHGMVQVWTERLREWLSMQVVRPLVNDVATFHEVGRPCNPLAFQSDSIMATCTHAKFGCF